MSDRNRVVVSPACTARRRVNIAEAIQLALDVAGVALASSGQTWVQVGADVSGEQLVLRFRVLH